MQSHRFRLALYPPAALLLMGAVLRVALYGSFHDGDFSVGALPLALGCGALVDLAVFALVLLPIYLVISLCTLRWLGNTWVRASVLTLFMAAALFLSAAEYFFFDEFNARFNHIAIDYVLYPHEVFVNIWESYHVLAVVFSTLAAGVLLAWPGVALTRGDYLRLSWRRRLYGAAAACGAAIAGLVVLGVMPAEVSDNRIVSEIAGNGLNQLVRAFKSAHLDYDLYYKTLPQEQALALSAQTLGFPQAGTSETTLQRHVVNLPGPSGKSFDVVVILEESLGSEFIGALNGAHANSPGFDRWCQDGLLLTNLVANGNRTVRGLEGVLCSFVSLPGDSVVKRDRSENVASIARVLRTQGYRTEFFYGGAGAFDNMKPFMLANGWDAFIEDGVFGKADYPKEAFRTAWGVADEHIFNALLTHQHAAEHDHKPFLGTVMSVSNHKPFLVPAPFGAKPRTSPERILKYGIIGAVLVATCLIAFLTLRRRLGMPVLVSLSVMVACIFGLVLWLKLSPHDTRDNAVRYSDWAVANYLDQAKAEGLLDHTVVLIVGDHGARVYGSEEIPAPSYRIPALFITPDTKWRNQRLDRLCSQIDLAPTVLELAGVSYRAPFLGESVIGKPGDGGRAFLSHNRDIGMLTDHLLAVLGLQKSITYYRRSGRDSDAFERIAPGDVDDSMRFVADQAASVFQFASDLYLNRRYTLDTDQESKPAPTP